MSNESYEPWNYMLVDTVQAGADLIEDSGRAKGCVYEGEIIPERILNNLEKSAAKALAAVAAYRKAIAATGHKATITKAEWKKHAA